MPAERPHAPQRFLTAEESARVVAAITAAERGTSAEFKLVILRHCWDDIRRKARELFHRHGLDRTADRNGVLILLVTTNHEFLVYGDEGIHRHVGEAFWREVRDVMAEHFRTDRFGDGLTAGIERIGAALATHFPAGPGDVNEVSDDVVHEDR